MDTHGLRLFKSSVWVCISEAPFAMIVWEDAAPAVTPGTTDWSAIAAAACELDGYDFDAACVDFAPTSVDSLVPNT